MYRVVLGILLALAFVGCGGNAQRQEQLVETDSIDNIIEDDLAALGDTLVINELPDTFAILAEMDSALRKVKTVEEARRIIASSPEAFEGSIIPRMLDEVPKYALRLLANPYKRFIVVDKNTMKVILYNKYGVLEKAYGMACSKYYGTKHKKADNRTPEGFFSVEGIYDSTDWLFTNDEGYTSKVKGQFGPRFIRIATPVSSQIGIHGTCAPWSIGGRKSHGCIRITNDNILELVELVQPGMPVIVNPGPKDMAVNRSEGYDVPAITIGKVAVKPAENVPEDNDPAAKPEDADSIAIDSVALPDTLRIAIDSIAASIPVDTASVTH